jgi:hypothetical protein
MSHDHDDFAFEKIPGLPADLPEGEQLLWQGSPDWKSHILYTYHVRAVLLYFAALLLWRIGAGFGAGHDPATVARSCLWLLGLGTIAAGMLGTLGYLSARTTIYSITSARVLLRHGIAVPLTVNIPFTLIEAADLRMRRDGTGDISQRLRADQRLGYFVTWPHLRPTRITRPQPSFRCLKDAALAAQILADAVQSVGGVTVQKTGLKPVAIPGGVGPRTAAAA